MGTLHLMHRIAAPSCIGVRCIMGHYWLVCWHQTCRGWILLVVGQDHLFISCSIPNPCCYHRVSSMHCLRSWLLVFDPRVYRPFSHLVQLAGTGLHNHSGQSHPRTFNGHVRDSFLSSIVANFFDGYVRQLALQR
jgi:hypothetical protein